MNVFRHPVPFGGGGCSQKLTELTSTGMSAVGIAIDPINKILMYQSAGTIYYGTYDSAGVWTQNGTMTGIPNQVGQSATQIMIDAERNFWFCAAQLDSTLVHGTYDTTTGQPTITGSLANIMSTSGDAHGVQIDPLLGLWWVGSSTSATQKYAYGSYNLTTGVPTQTGSEQPVPSASGANVFPNAIDIMHQHIWWSSAVYVQGYDSSGLLSSTTTVDTLVGGGEIDYDRSILIAPSSDWLSCLIMEVAADGTLTEKESLVTSGTVWAMVIDTDFGLIFDLSGDVFSYCK